jgi:hypothetical protein
MPQSAAPNPQADADRLEAAADQAIAACGGDVRDALKALIMAKHQRFSWQSLRNGDHARFRRWALTTMGELLGSAGGGA